MYEVRTIQGELCATCYSAGVAALIVEDLVSRFQGEYVIIKV